MRNKEQLKGKVQQAVAKLTGDEELEKKGEANERVGDVKEALDRVNANAVKVLEKLQKKAIED